MGVRFAPSPTGAFHLGNFRTAWISWRWAQALALPWVVRFEDIDRPRVVAGAQARQLDEMRELGLVPDQVFLQSERASRHWEVFQAARAAGQVYPCTCSRKEIREALERSASAPHEHTPEPVYSGECRNAQPGSVDLVSVTSVAWRFKTEDPREDFIVGRTRGRTSGHTRGHASGHSSGHASGQAQGSADLTERDFFPAYHWACAIDDWDGGYALLVRAWDLAPAALVQRKIQAWLGPDEARLPAVFHTALITQNDGHRLEKRTRAVTLPELRAQGIGPEEIRARFEASFRLEPSEFAPGRLFGEAAKTLRLAELGF